MTYYFTLTTYIQDLSKLYEVDWVSLLSPNSCSDNFDIFLAKLNEILDTVAPLKEVWISAKRCFVEPWMTKGLELASRKKRELYKLSIHACNNAEDRKAYVDYCNSYNRLK